MGVSLRRRAVGGNGTLNPRQKKFLTALVAHPTVRAAAQAAGIAETTAWRYMQEPDFRAAVAERTDAVLAQTTSALVEDMNAARQVLRDVMKDKAETSSVRVRAATAVLDAGLRMAELLALAQRVAALEVAVQSVRRGESEETWT